MIRLAHICAIRVCLQRVRMRLLEFGMGAVADSAFQKGIGMGNSVEVEE